jgi:hypothetical protein
VSNVLVVTALELRDPIAMLVHAKAGDSTRNGQCVTYSVGRIQLRHIRIRTMRRNGVLDR